MKIEIQINNMVTIPIRFILWDRKLTFKLYKKFLGFKKRDMSDYIFYMFFIRIHYRKCFGGYYFYSPKLKLRRKGDGNGNF